MADDSREGKRVICSRLAAAEVARVQAAISDSVLLAQPCEEALETQSVTAVRRRSVPEIC